MEKVKLRNRSVHIEQLRVAAIFVVIVLHCYAPFFVDYTTYGTKTWWGVNIINSLTRWGVPIFLMISGMLLIDTDRHESIKEFLKKRSIKILIPFVFWSVIYYINTAIIRGNQVSVVEFVEKFLGKNIYYHLWFVYTLFGLYLLVPILRKLARAVSDRELWYFFGIIFFTTSIRPIISKFFGINIIAIIPIFDGYLGWFLYGYLINRVKFNRKQRIIVYILGILAAVTSIIGTYMLSDLFHIDAFFNGGYQINSYFIATAVFVLFKYEISSINSKKWLEDLSISMGKLSYGVYLIHILILETIQRLLTFNIPYIQILCCSILTFVFSYIIMYLLSKVFKKWRLLRLILTGTQ